MQSVISVAAFYEGGYDAILDIQIEMLYEIFELLQVDRIQITNNKVEIKNANYNSHFIFPNVESVIK